MGRKTTGLGRKKAGLPLIYIGNSAFLFWIKKNLYISRNDFSKKSTKGGNGFFKYF